MQWIARGIALVSLSALAGCGGGAAPGVYGPDVNGNSGSIITTDNAVKLSAGIFQGTKASTTSRKLDLDGASQKLVFGGTAKPQTRAAVTCPAGSGTYSVVHSTSGSNEVLTFTYADCAVPLWQGTVTVNGSMVFTFRYDWYFTTYYLAYAKFDYDLDVTSGGQRETGVGSLEQTCTSDQTSDCSITSSYTDADNTTVTVENVEEDSNTDGTPNTITGRYGHPEHGTVDVATSTPFSYDANCPGTPVGGVMRSTAADGSYSEFRPSSCSQFQNCTGNSCDTYDWVEHRY